MSKHDNRSAYVKSPWQFEVRDNPVEAPGPGQILVEIGACSVCGTDLHIADRLAQDWQPIGHEVAGTVRAVGEGVDRFVPGDRVSIDSSAPCGKCSICQPPPFGRGRPELCATSASYWGTGTMGFGRMLLTPHQPAIKIPDSMLFDVASLGEPLGVSIDLVQTADVRPGDHVLVIGPGPLGLGAIPVARRAGAEKIWLAGMSRSKERMRAGEALGADELIWVDKAPVGDFDFGARKPDKILVVSPPDTLPEAIKVVAFGGIVAYIGLAFGPGSEITFDADDFHFRKLSLRASMAGPAVHLAESITLLASAPEIARELITHRFALDEIAEIFAMGKPGAAKSFIKLVMMNP